MKTYNERMKCGIIISILIVLLTFGIVGTVAAADPQAAVPGGWSNGTPHMAYYQNATANGNMWGHGNMMRGSGNRMRGYGNGMGMRGGAGAAQAKGGMHTGFMFFGAILTILLMIVWLIVGILVIVLILKKFSKAKTP
jgi:hypothetical protein